MLGNNVCNIITFKRRASPTYVLYAFMNGK